MADIPILGETKPLSSEPELPEPTDEQKEALAAMAEAAGVDPSEGLPKVETAFLVIVTKHGSTVATHDLNEVNAFSVERPATADDMYAACAVVQKDIQIQEQATATVQTMMATTQAMAQKAQEAQMRQKLGI
jgi:hypothetical protein